MSDIWMEIAPEREATRVTAMAGSRTVRRSPASASIASGGRRTGDSGQIPPPRGTAGRGGLEGYSLVPCERGGNGSRGGGLTARFGPLRPN
jgi:hypothetical protein